MSFLSRSMTLIINVNAENKRHVNNVFVYAVVSMKCSFFRRQRVIFMSKRNEVTCIRDCCV